MLVDISERKHAEETVARHRDEQSALYRFTDRLFRAGSLSDVCDAALAAIDEALGCKRSSILLFDDAGVMRFVAWSGLSDAYRQAVEGHSPWTRETKDAQPICIDDIEVAEISDALKATVKAEGIGALAFIPLVANGALVGKFMTYYEAPHSFSEGDINLSVTIARQLGFSIARLRAEEARSRAEQASRLLASIIETSDDAIISKNLDGIITSWNQGAERVFGYTADETVGRSILMLIPPDRHQEEQEIIGRLRAGQRIEHFETVRQRKDGNSYRRIADGFAREGCNRQGHRRIEDCSRYQRAQTVGSAARAALQRDQASRQEHARRRFRPSPARPCAAPPKTSWRPSSPGCTRWATLMTC